MSNAVSLIAVLWSGGGNPTPTFYTPERTGGSPETSPPSPPHLFFPLIYPHDPPDHAITSVPARIGCHLFAAPILVALLQLSCLSSACTRSQLHYLVLSFPATPTSFDEKQNKTRTRSYTNTRTHIRTHNTPHTQHNTQHTHITHAQVRLPCTNHHRWVSPYETLQTPFPLAPPPSAESPLAMRFILGTRGGFFPLIRETAGGGGSSPHGPGPAVGRGDRCLCLAIISATAREPVPDPDPDPDPSRW